MYKLPPGVPEVPRTEITQPEEDAGLSDMTEGWVYLVGCLHARLAAGSPPRPPPNRPLLLHRLLGLADARHWDAFLGILLTVLKQIIDQITALVLDDLSIVPTTSPEHLDLSLTANLASRPRFPPAPAFWQVSTPVSSWLVAFSPRSVS